jgi:hypothetical protein
MKTYLSFFFALLMACTFAEAQNCNTLQSSINENFNSTANGTRPPCWSGFYTQVQSQTANYVQAGEYWIQRTNTGAAIPEHFMVVMPRNTVKGPLQFQLKKYPNGGSLSLEVGTLSNKLDATTFTNFQTVSTITSSPTNMTVDFSSYNGADTYIAFRAYLLPGEGFSFDNIVFSGPPPVLQPAKSVKGF